MGLCCKSRSFNTAGWLYVVCIRHSCMAKAVMLDSLRGLFKQNHSAINRYGVAQTFTMVDYVREMTRKKACTSGECRSLEHLLFLFVFVFFFMSFLLF